MAFCRLRPENTMIEQDDKDKPRSDAYSFREPKAKAMTAPRYTADALHSVADELAEGATSFTAAELVDMLRQAAETELALEAFRAWLAQRMDGLPDYCPPYLELESVLNELDRRFGRTP
jgi:hypothetical protein